MLLLRRSSDEAPSSLPAQGNHLLMSTTVTRHLDYRPVAAIGCRLLLLPEREAERVRGHPRR